MNQMDLRLVAYDADGERLGTLPQPLSLDLGLPLNDLPSLTIRYTLHAARGELVSRALHAGTIIAVEATAGGGWNEIAGARFIVQAYSTDTVDEQRVYDLTCTSWVAELRYGIIERNQDGDSRNFVWTNPGAIMARLLNDVADAGGLPHMVYNFGHVADSAGQEWGQGETLPQVEYQIGDDLLSVLQNLVELGIVDWTTRGDELLIYRPNTVLANRWDTGADHRDLLIGRDITEAPESATFEDVASRIVVRGQDGLEVTETNPSAPAPFGHRTIYHSAGGVSDEGTLRKIGQLELAQRAVTKLELTRGLSLARARWLPILNYEPGDYVMAPGAQQEMQSLRVRQVTLQRDESGTVSGNVTLNDRFVERELRNALKLASVLRGVSGSGTDSDPGEDRPERQVPAIVGTPLVSTSTYLDTRGEPRGQVSMVWSAVTQDTRGRSIEIDSYQIAQRHIAPHNLGGWHAMNHVSQTTHTMSPFEIDSIWAFRVRARSTSGVYGAWSVPAEITIQPDTTPPPQPSPPQLESRLGVVSVDWDGLAFQGTQMPPDFSHVEVHVSQSIGFDPTPGTVYDTLFGANPGVTVITGLEYHDLVAVVLVAVDTSGNRSDPSEERDATVTPLVDTDLIETTIDDRFNAAQDAISDINDNVIPGVVSDIDGELTEIRHDISVAGRITVSPIRPGPGHVPGRAEGHLWYLYVGDTLVGIWRLSGGSWVPLPLSRTMIPLLDIGSGTFGDLDGGRLKANTVATNALAVGGPSNLVVDPEFADNDLTQHRVDVSDGEIASSSQTVQQRARSEIRVINDASGRNELHFVSAPVGGLYDNLTPIEPGAKLRFGIWVRAHAGIRWRFVYRTLTTADNTGYGNVGEWHITGDQEWVEEIIETADTHQAAGMSIQVEYPGASIGDMARFELPVMTVQTPGVLIEDGAIVADHITSNNILSRHIASLQIETGHLKANAITADKADIGDLRGQIISGRVIRGEHLQIGTITPKELAGVGVNHVADPGFEDPPYWNGADGVIAAYGGSGAVWATSTLASNSGTRSLRADFDGSTVAFQYITGWIPAPASNRVYVGVHGRRGSGPRAPASDVEFTISLQVTRNDGTHEYSSAAFRQFPDGTSWQPHEEVIGIPGYATAYRVRLYVRRSGGGVLANSSVYFDDVVVQDATMSMGASRVQIDPTGLRVIQSGVGSRITLTASGLKGRNNAGQLTLDFDTQTGNMTTAGAFRTGFSRPYIYIAHHQGRPAMMLHSAGSRSSWPARIASGGGQDQDAIAVYSARRTGDEANMSLTLFPGVRGFRLGATAAGRPYFSGGNPSGDESFFAGIYGGGPFGSLLRRPAITGNADGTWGVGHSQKHLIESGAHLRLINNDGTTWILGQPLMLMGGQVRFTTIASTSSPTRIGITSNNQIVAVSSTRRIKANIESLDTDPGLGLRLTERQWIDTSEAGLGTRGAGLVAEEAEDAGLPEPLLTRDDDGLVDGIHYDQAWVVLLPLLRQLNDRINTLEGNA